MNCPASNATSAPTSFAFFACASFGAHPSGRSRFRFLGGLSNLLEVEVEVEVGEGFIEGFGKPFTEGFPEVLTEVFGEGFTEGFPEGFGEGSG